MRAGEKISEQIRGSVMQGVKGVYFFDKHKFDTQKLTRKDCATHCLFFHHIFVQLLFRSVGRTCFSINFLIKCVHLFLRVDICSLSKKYGPLIKVS